MIDLDRDGDVWVLTMRDEENRFTQSWLEEFSAALDRVEASDGARALVTAGTGKFYSTGLDLEWLRGAGDAGPGFLDGVHKLFGRLLGFPAITVAAVTGHAFAAGAMLATAHDFVIMRADRGWWCLPEAELGLPLTPAMYSVIATKLPRRTAAEAVLTGRRYPAEDALAAGIVHRTAAPDQVIGDAIMLAKALAGKDRRALTAHKQLLYGEAISICVAGIGAEPGPAGHAGGAGNSAGGARDGAGGAGNSTGGAGE